MNSPSIRFEDGAAYEAFMGRWSRLAGERFLQFLAPEPGGHWLDVGCGNGAFTELLMQRCAPASVQGIDPSPAQIAFARQRPGTAGAVFEVGDAMALPQADASVDAAVMALVIFFVPEPARAVAEMARVLRPGGSASAYAWDLLGGGFPFAVIQDSLAELGVAPLWPPSPQAAELQQLQALWQQAGFVDVATDRYEVTREFDSFEAFWQIAQSGPRLAPGLSSLEEGARQQLQDAVRRRLPPGPGPLVVRATAHAVRGRKPALPA
ncbi:class I SAM-dependent methyltransferase [Aquincola tertiaricarbonis]|uniref:Class I SAM-dependent methyltransferase n=1 Tax=Aquincola tertiaricarbonis TaxID=391953 RepID=A0ABY4SFC8_AQUTE|nr:class I SAM-dependent methyltransferase [Aquincola tertiaricarbonis]URI11290.1 class I SAM-dependent methyltransferase [Aquincola tertiaricarbonis]